MDSPGRFHPPRGSTRLRWLARHSPVGWAGRVRRTSVHWHVCERLGPAAAVSEVAAEAVRPTQWLSRRAWQNVGHVNLPSSMR